MPVPVVLRAKCILVGDSTVGKTALTQSFSSDGTQFAKSYYMTTGVDVCVKAVAIPNTNVTVELYIYDSAGKDIFSDFVQEFWDEPHLVLVAYDVTNKQSLKSCAKWLERVKAKKTTPELQLPGVLVGTKVDLVQRRVVSEEDARKTAQAIEAEYFECSAKTPENVDKPFAYLAEQFYQLHNEDNNTNKNSMNIT